MQNRIRDLRQQRKLTQAELALLVDVDETAVSRWESGARPLTPTVLARLAKVFKCETWEVLVDRDGLRRFVGGPDVMPESENQTRRTAKADQTRRTAKADASDRDAEKEDDAR